MVMSTGPMLPVPPFVEPKVAVLWSVPQLPPVVGEVTCNVMVAPAAKVKVPVVAGLVPQLKVWVGGDPLTAHAMPEGIEVPVGAAPQIPVGVLADDE